MSTEYELELESAARRVGWVVLGRYRIEELLGMGGVGVVYRALDCETGDLVVVKTLRDGLLEVPTIGPRFLREARIAMSLQHPAIARGIAVGLADEGTPVLVMEYVTGRDLLAVTTDSLLSISDALRVGARVAEALAVAHAAGVVHRDIKPENIMLLDGAEIPLGVYVLDFGIAFCLDEPRFTAANTVIGTPPYLSPEQARGDVVTSASDLYSLGATLVDLLTGKTLYEGATLLQIASHQSAPIPDWGLRRADLPAPVVAFVNALLEKDPSRRPENATLVAEMLQALARWSERPEGAPPTPGAFHQLAETCAPTDDELVLRLRELQRKHHRVMHDSAEAQRRIVQQLVDLSARAIERAQLGGAVGVADAARESALESALTKLQQHSLREQAEILRQLREVRGRLLQQRGG